MPMMLVQGLGQGSPSSAPGSALGAFDFGTVPNDLIEGAKKWMSPGTAFGDITGLATTEGRTAAFAKPVQLAGLIGVPLLLLLMVASGGRKRF